MMRKWALAMLPLLLGVAAVVPLTRWAGNTVFYVETNVATAAGLLGGVISLVLVLGLWRAEIVQQKMAQIRAQEEEDRARFMGRLDHQLRNPLTAMQTTLERLAKAGLTPEQTKIVGILSPHVERLSTLNTGLRKLSDLQEGKLQRSKVNLEKLLNEATGLVKQEWAEQSREVVLNLRQTPWPLPDISGDYDLLLLCIQNLLDNAFKFSRPGAKIEVFATATRDDSAVEIDVADTGIGIPEEDLPHLGEELYRGKNSSVAAGNGLGLALVRVIVHLHGGEFWPQSRPGGTMMTIHLPIKAPVDETERAGQPEPAPRSQA